jgi:hypothetical protein
MLALKAWLRAHPLLRDVLAIALAAVVVSGLAVAVLWFRGEKRAQDCRAAGNRWSEWGCVERQKECFHEGIRIPVGAKFHDGCNFCECTPFWMKCTAKWCPGPRSMTCASECDACVYEQGCPSTHSYCSAWSHGPKQTYCSCEGLTFEASTPNRPFQHVGPCD